MGGVYLGGVDMSPVSGGGGGGILTLSDFKITFLSTALVKYGAIGGLSIRGIVCTPEAWDPTTPQCGVWIQRNTVVVTTQKPPAVTLFNRWQWAAVAIIVQITIPTVPQIYPPLDVNIAPQPSGLTYPILQVHKNHFSLKSGSVTTSLLTCTAAGDCTPRQSEIMSSIVISVEVSSNTTIDSQEPYVVDATENTMKGDIDNVLPILNENFAQVGIAVVFVNYDTTRHFICVIATVQRNFIEALGFANDTGTLAQIPAALVMTVFNSQLAFISTSYVKGQNCLASYQLLSYTPVLCVDTLSLIHISEPTRLLSISYAVFCLKKKKNNILNTTYTRKKH
eukprot:TRINITY_DN48955_c0_g1_i1.p1 TRINITY_DN48955_c0_g1~~TRINITY_DN48955_c0_g1_i1.p1  ORF type:complete len:337 (+),score=22.62 TRINITY_DN48955_c0_g1_i1:195-1205(+)